MKMYEEEKKSKVAIFLVMLFITLLVVAGVIVYLFLKDSVIPEESSEEEQVEISDEVKVFNEIFLVYIDNENVSSSNAEELIGAVIKNNSESEYSITLDLVDSSDSQNIEDQYVYIERLLEDQTYSITIRI